MTRRFETRPLPRNRLPVWFAVAASLLLSAQEAAAASNTLVSPDSNSRITVENAVVKNGGTTVLFFTHPDLGDPLSGKRCSLNFYVVKLREGLPDARATPAALGVCANAMAEARLLENGETLIVAGDRVERWRGGERIESKPFGSLEATRGIGVDSGYGGQFYDITPNGDLVAGIPTGGAIQRDVGAASMVLLRLDREGRLRWQHRFESPGQESVLAGVWASSGGSALARVSVRDASGASMAVQEYLYLIDKNGKRRGAVQISRDETPDMEALMRAAQANPQAAMTLMNSSVSEAIEKLVAIPRPDGGFDVLLQRSGGTDGRQGHFLLDIGPDGSLRSERPVTDPIAEYGLDDWHGVMLKGNELVLLSRAFASQPGVQARRDGYMQNLISHIDLGTGTVSVRRVPLDQRYLVAAMNAGDAEIQYLDNMPGGDPVLLTTVGQKPLAVSVGWLSRKQGLRFDSESADWQAFTDVVDQRRAAQAKEVARDQRRAAREQGKQDMNAALAASVGMSPEQFAALSSKERKEAMVRNGDFDAMMAAANAQAAALQQSASAGTGAQPAAPPASQDMQAQLAAAIADAERQAAVGTGNPELDAQMAAAMAQIKAMQQGMGGVASSVPQTSSPASAPAAEIPDEKALKVNAQLQGFVEFENRDGHPTTLLIYDRRSGEELLSKSYDDGVIYEFVDFSRFKRPLPQIGVMYRDVSGLVLKDLTPVIE